MVVHPRAPTILHSNKAIPYTFQAQSDSSAEKTRRLEEFRRFEAMETGTDFDSGLRAFLRVWRKRRPAACREDLSDASIHAAESLVKLRPSASVIHKR